MSEVHQPLFALLEVMLNLATPKVNPGGYSEDMFLDLTEEDKEEFTCSICYQILKDTRMCLNNHKYCYSCIFVWSTSGPAINHGRCPVCRTDGFYLKNKQLDDKIGMKKVKCQMKSCRWRGPLKILSNHQHSTYTRTGLPMYRSETRNENLVNNNELPRLGEETRNTRDNQTSPRIRTMSELRQQATRSSTRRNQRNTISDIQNDTETYSSLTPHPPTTPRPQGQTSRRVPTLPSIVNQNQHRENASDSRTPRSRFDSRIASRPQQTNTNIRDRLRESRSRLDSLMSNFTSELERGRREIEDFQEERERRRQEQLNEVRELGQRLGVVAQELRNLLTQRRQLRDEIEEASDTSV